MQITSADRETSAGQSLAEYALLVSVLALGVMEAYAVFREGCDEALRRIAFAVSLPFPL